MSVYINRPYSIQGTLLDFYKETHGNYSRFLGLTFLLPITLINTWSHNEMEVRIDKTLDYIRNKLMHVLAGCGSRRWSGKTPLFGLTKTSSAKTHGAVMCDNCERWIYIKHFSNSVQTVNVNLKNHAIVNIVVLTTFSSLSLTQI